MQHKLLVKRDLVVRVFSLFDGRDLCITVRALLQEELLRSAICVKFEGSAGEEL